MTKGIGEVGRRIEFRWDDEQNSVGRRVKTAGRVSGIGKSAGRRRRGDGLKSKGDKMGRQGKGVESTKRLEEEGVGDVEGKGEVTGRE